MSDLADLMDEVLAFRNARDWAQYHTPRHLAAGLSIEASELQETMLWKSDTEIEARLREDKFRGTLEEEIADVLIYTLLICHSLNVHPAEAVRKKLKVNEGKYPVNLARGVADKYTELLKRKDAQGGDPK